MPEIALERAREAGVCGDAEWVRRAAAGDAEAFDRLVELHWRGLVRLARVVLASDLEAEDLAQDALTHAWARIGSLRRPERFAAWVRRILVRDAVRRERRRRARRATAGLAEAEALAAASAPPTARLEVAEALRVLAPRQRAVFFLLEVDGLTVSEAAAALDIAEATVRVHRLLARRRLRAFAAGGAT